MNSEVRVFRGRAEEGENPMTEYFIDLEELLARSEHDRELARDLLSIFQEEFPQRHQALREVVLWTHRALFWRPAA